MANCRHYVTFVVVVLVAHPAVLRSQTAGALPASQGSIRSGHPVKGLTLTLAPELDEPANAAGTTVRVTVGSGRLPPRSYLTLHWHPDDLPAGVKASEMVVMRWSGTGWSTVVPQARSDDSVTVTVAGSGIWALRWNERRKPCTDPGYHTFDFRIGRWSYASPGYTPGTSVVSADDSHCALHDDYLDIKGGRSRTFFRFDSATSRWFNTTIDPGGRTRSSGIVDSTGISFYQTPTAHERYTQLGDSAIGYVIEQSDDGGKRWRVTAAATYRRVPMARQ